MGRAPALQNALKRAHVSSVSGGMRGHYLRNWQRLGQPGSRGWEEKIPEYIVNRNAQYDSRDHEVHVTPRSACDSPRYPEPENQVALGSFATCSSAVSV